ncbi:hypothetical protein [Alteromonas gracilis]|uniref:hypothetical protein n=1 Tax=Alteromonas gracilis TaxID=1479524 RepID=UPI0037366495
MKKFATFCGITILLSVFSTCLYSQEETKENELSSDEWKAYLDNLAPEKNDITDFSMVYFFDVETGQEEKFESLVTEYFIEGSKLAEVPVPTLYSMTTGEYGYMVIYPATNPGEQFEFSRTKDDVKFLRALGKKYSKDEINGAFDTVYSLIKRSKRIIIGKVAPY